jgi:hypothetical protein
MTTTTRRCHYSYEPLLGDGDAQRTPARAPVQCPVCDRTLRALRHWGDGSVARYPAHSASGAKAVA